MKRRKLLQNSLAYALLLSSVQSFAKVPVENKLDIQLIITFHIKKEKLQSFMKIVNDVKKNLPKVDGCKGVEIFQANDDKQIITFIETWENIEKHKKHIEHVVDSGDWEYISSHLIADPKSQYYQAI